MLSASGILRTLLITIENYSIDAILLFQAFFVLQIHTAFEQL